jgi:hypothetical protein
MFGEILQQAQPTKSPQSWGKLFFSEKLKFLWFKGENSKKCLSIKRRKIQFSIEKSSFVVLIVIYKGKFTYKSFQMIIYPYEGVTEAKCFNGFWWVFEEQ